MSWELNPGQQSLRPNPPMHQPNHNSLTFHRVSSTSNHWPCFLHIIFFVVGKTTSGTFQAVLVLYLHLNAMNSCPLYEHFGWESLNCYGTRFAHDKKPEKLSESYL